MKKRGRKKGQLQVGSLGWRLDRLEVGDSDFFEGDAQVFMGRVHTIMNRTLMHKTFSCHACWATERRSGDTYSVIRVERTQ